jgi:effector-binding domain-containing protein
LADFITINLPDAMIQSMNELCQKKGLTNQEFIKTAISTMLFEQFKSSPEVSISINQENDFNLQKNVNISNYEIPLDKVITVQYTLEDGKIIHIIRGKKSQ